MVALDYRNGVSIFEIVFYSPALLVSIFLCIKHGFGRSSGWYFLTIFSLARLIGASLQLATIASPTNVSLYIGALILQNIGISPLLLCSLGLLSRVISNINYSKMTPVTPSMLKFVELLVTIGLILGIIGGTDSGSDFSNTGQYSPQSKSKAAVILFLVAWLLLVGSTIVTFASISAASPSHRRLLIVIAASSPFLLVRVLYSVISSFSSTGSIFNTLSGSVTLLLVMSLIMEVIVVFFYEAIGLTLEKDTGVPIPIGQNEGEELRANERSETIPKDNGLSSRVPKEDNALLRFAKYTIIGRIVMSFVGDRESDRDVEMQRRYERH